MVTTKRLKPGSVRPRCWNLSLSALMRDLVPDPRLKRRPCACARETSGVVSATATRFRDLRTTLNEEMASGLLCEFVTLDTLGSGRCRSEAAAAPVFLPVLRSAAKRLRICPDRVMIQHLLVSAAPCSSAVGSFFPASRQGPWAHPCVTARGHMTVFGYPRRLFLRFQSWKADSLQ